MNNTLNKKLKKIYNFLNSTNEANENVIDIIKDDLLNEINIFNNINLLLMNYKKEIDETINIFNNKFDNKINLEVIQPIIDTNKKLNHVVSIPVQIVDTFDNIPSVPIYYLKDHDIYGININNNIITGNIGNIHNNKTRKTKTKKNNICKIKNCNNKYCKKYIQNYYNYNWIFDKNNNLSRKIGSRETLINDIIYIDNYEINMRNSQLMHDILLYCILQKQI